MCDWRQAQGGSKAIYCSPIVPPKFPVSASRGKNKSTVNQYSFTAINRLKVLANASQGRQRIVLKKIGFFSLGLSMLPGNESQDKKVKAAS